MRKCKRLEIPDMEVLSKSTVNEVEVRCNPSVKITWNSATQHVSLARGDFPENSSDAQVRSKMTNQWINDNKLNAWM